MKDDDTQNEPAASPAATPAASPDPATLPQKTFVTPDGSYDLRPYQAIGFGRLAPYYRVIHAARRDGYTWGTIAWHMGLGGWRRSHVLWTGLHAARAKAQGGGLSGVQQRDSLPVLPDVLPGANPLNVAREAARQARQRERRRLKRERRALRARPPMSVMQTPGGAVARNYPLREPGEPGTQPATPRPPRPATVIVKKKRHIVVPSGDGTPT